MHGERDGRSLSSPSPSMSNDETTKNDPNASSANVSSLSSSQNPSTELAYLPLGCSVSAKYRGAFCSAQVKAIEKQVKLKVTLVDSGDTITISEEQIVQSVPLRIGNNVTIRLNSSNRRQSNDSNSHSHYSRSGLAAFIHSNNPDEKQATIKQIIDNSMYTVVFNDGDEKSLRRSSLCLQGVRLYQTQYGQQKILEEIPTNPPNTTINTNPSSSTAPPSSSISPPLSLPSSSDTSNTNVNDAASIVAIQRQGNADQSVFPALVLKRKALADYMWVRSFVDGREYIVHTRDDVQPYHNNPNIQTLCRTTSKQATQACEKFLKFNQIPAVWQKKKQKKGNKTNDKNRSSDEENTSDNDSSSDESDDDEDEDDDDEIDEETAEEKDSFVAQLFAFMDDRGTPINNIPKVQNYDLDLHRLFKIVRLFGGYNRVTKNDQWEKIHIKMGLPDETSTVNGRSIEDAYKKYLFAYEDLSKKLGSMNAPSAYLGGRTSLGSDSRRSLIRVRQQQQQQEEEKLSKKIVKPKSTAAAVKQRSGKSQESRPSVDTKPTPSSAKKGAGKPSTPVTRKAPTKSKLANVISSSSSESESETSDDDSSKSSASDYDTRKTKGKPAPPSSTKKPSAPTSSASTISKKIPPPSSSSKTDLQKKPNTNVKSSTSSTHDSKPSKLTITIPISSSKSKTSNTTTSIKKSSSISVSNDEKKKLSAPKTETKTVPVSSTKKPISSSASSSSSSSKSSQVVKPTPSTKHSMPESSKTSSSTSNKTSSSSTSLSFKPKSTQSQTSTSSQNKDRSVSKTPSSSVDARSVKPNKINIPSSKGHLDDRSHSVSVKKPKPIVKEEVLSKPLSSSTMKIPKLSSHNDAAKKSTQSTEKVTKKQVSKDGAVKTSTNSENSSSTQPSKGNTEQLQKSHSSSPSGPVAAAEPVKKPVISDISPSPVTPGSPVSTVPPTFSSVSSISEDPITPTTTPLPVNTIQSLSYPSDQTPEVKPLESPLIFQALPIPLKETSEHGSPSSTSMKRPHTDDIPELPNTSAPVSDTDEQPSPSKRLRRSISSQESIDTLSSNDQPGSVDLLPSHRNTQLTYEEIAINDVLLVKWGSAGVKLYPARCIAKNDEKNELLVHYIKYNPRHDEWIKIDRVIERTDSANGQTVFQARPRRTSQPSALRHSHLDSTTNSSTITSSSSEPSAPLQTPLAGLVTSLIAGIIGSSTLTDHDNDETHKTILIDKKKTTSMDESDLDENSQENNRLWPQLEAISSTDEDAVSSASTNRTSQSDMKLSSEEISIRRVSISTITNVHENILPSHQQVDFRPIGDSDHETGIHQDHTPHIISKRRASRVASVTTKPEQVSNIHIETIEPISLATSEALEQSHQYPLHVKQEFVETSCISQSNSSMPIIPITLTLKTEPVPPSANILSSPTTPTTGIRRASTRQLKRRTLRESHTSKDSSLTVKKKTKFDNGVHLHSDISVDSNANNDQLSTRSNSTEQQINENTTTKRNRPAGRRGGKRAANQQDFENDDYRSNSPSYVTMRQQLKDMFKHRPSRYNFLDLNNNLTGDERITHLKDRMRECQKVFFNLKSALVKIEKQRKIFLRKQKPMINIGATATAASPIVQPANTEILATSTCT